jgi:[ribosomal protein S5]-alanine N-acetyltransferase
MGWYLLALKNGIHGGDESCDEMRMAVRLLPVRPQYLRALLESADALEQIAGLRVAEGIRDFMLMASPEFLRRLESAEEADPWEWGFAIVHADEDLWIGSAGYKGAPDAKGCVEIAYGMAPAYWGRGYATDAARGLVEYAFADPRVVIVCAHTLPEPNASTRVLAKCEFIKTGEVVDPEDGLVWRWEKRRDSDG